MPTNLVKCSVGKLGAGTEVGLLVANPTFVSIQKGLPLPPTGGAFHIEAFRFRGLAVVMLLCGLLAGLFWVLTPDSPKPRSAIEQHSYAHQH